MSATLRVAVPGTPELARRGGGGGALLRSPAGGAAAALAARGLTLGGVLGAPSAHGDVRRVRRADGAAFALKRQRIRWPRDLAAERAYRELRVARRLGELAQRGACVGFVGVVDWFKVRGEPTPGAAGGGRRARGRAARQYMYYVLELCDTTLAAERGALSFAALKSVAFQLLFALAVARREFEFVHADLHAKNVLLQTLAPGAAVRVHCHGRVFRCPAYAVKIGDFGLSRVTLADGSVVFNDRFALTELFDACAEADVLRLEHTFQDIGKRALERAVSESGGGPLPPDADATVDWQNCAALRRRMRRGEPLHELLVDDFFDDLQVAVEPETPRRRSRRLQRQLLSAADAGAPPPATDSAPGADAAGPADPTADRVCAYDFGSTTARTALAAPARATEHRRKTRSVKLAERQRRMRAYATEVVAGGRHKSATASADDTDAENAANAELSAIRKRLTFSQD